MSATSLYTRAQLTRLRLLLMLFAPQSHISGALYSHDYYLNSTCGRCDAM